jgi:hypothetical protein
MKKYARVGVSGHVFIISALDGGEWSASGSGRFNPGERAVVPVKQEARWAPRSVWSLWRRLCINGKTDNRE